MVGPMVLQVNSRGSSLQSTPWYRRQHQAIDEVMKNFGKEVLFPNAVKTNAPQVEFVLENPILDYTVYRSKNKIQSNRHLNLSSSTSNTSLSPTRRYYRLGAQTYLTLITYLVYITLKVIYPKYRISANSFCP